MESTENKTKRIDLNGHVFFTCPLNDRFDLIVTDDDLIKSAMIDLNTYYEDVVDLAYDEEDAEYVVKGEDGEEYWGEDADGATLFFVHKKMLQFRISTDSGSIGFMVNKEAHANQEKMEEAMERLKKTGEAETCDSCGKSDFREEMNPDDE